MFSKDFPSRPPPAKRLMPSSKERSTETVASAVAGNGWGPWAGARTRPGDYLLGIPQGADLAMLWGVRFGCISVE